MSTTQVRLGNRVEIARAGALFSGVVQRDSRGNPSVVLTPGSEGKQYDVIIKRRKLDDDTPALVVECLLKIGIGNKPCPGASVSVCKHQMSAAVKIAAERGFNVSFCSTLGHAKRVANLRNGKVIALVSKTGGKRVWLVVSS